MWMIGRTKLEDSNEECAKRGTEGLLGSKKDSLDDEECECSAACIALRIELYSL